jgi:hypothetical protein
MTCMNCGDNTQGLPLKTDLMARWIETEWMPRQPDQDWQTMVESVSCLHQQVLIRFDRHKPLPDSFTFNGEEAIPCPVITPVAQYAFNGDVTQRTGAFVFRFAVGEKPVGVLVMASFFTDENHIACLACVPVDFLPVWAAFMVECERLSGALNPVPRVRIIGGHASSFEPTVAWDEIVLPEDLKADLLSDVEAFFTKGVNIYKRLNLKPFRKLLLAGIPGTGKTMLCMALAKWALDREYLVIYISSNDYSGAAFWKIEQALNIAAASELPAMILLEELDAYVSDDEDKALVLNVLDGAEARENERGTLLIATTNYPEAIDERVLKRPGRLDRIFIVPEMRDRASAEKMLRHYLGEYWREEHGALAKGLVGYPGAFIREVAIHAMTRMAFADQDELSFALLEESFDRLLDQITAKDDFLSRHRNNGLGFSLEPASGNGKQN